MRVDFRAERLNRGLTVEQMAEAVGVSPGAWFRAEQGSARPNPGNAKAIADFFGHKVTDLWPLDDKAAA